MGSSEAAILSVKSQVLLGTFVHSKTAQALEYMHNTAIAVDSHGTVVGIERDADDVESAKGKLLASLGWCESDVHVCASREGQFFFPGFIDTHVHAPQYANVGIFGKSSLLGWLEKYTFPLESSLKDLDRARMVYNACVRRTLSHGTTTAAYYATIDVAATNLLSKLCLDRGQRAFIGRVCMDRPVICPDYYRDESAEQALKLTLDSIAYINKIDPKHDMVSPILTPRFAPACTSEAMHALSKVQRQLNLPVQTHISENKDEVCLVRDLFPDAKSYADVYDKHGLLTPKTILAHAVHITDAEADLIVARKSKIAHCPCSNSSLTSGEARVRWMWDKGIDVGLGTDMSGGYSPSILEAARHAALVSRHLAVDIADCKERERVKLTVDEALFLATRGGAKVVGLEDKVGGFDVGKKWDAQLVGLAVVRPDGSREGEREPPPAHHHHHHHHHHGGGGDEEHNARQRGDAGNVDIFGWEAWEDRVAKWVYNGDDRNTKMVWVNGRLVHSRP
ncbi:Guanine deaminase [Purpureocillium takamizusanense]|uniref:Probable guanine deaminase n=1 Tax=Purpureocillium takamizusanense TaxID=2060973 RepID=A0A9Q8QLW0_9HYPO|nr:Guanine deaminase [Purpureocillium takamizusanense]UNI22020.1 Guanine deaminase [Purpureocillium takamizusanense]